MITDSRIYDVLKYLNYSLPKIIFNSKKTIIDTETLNLNVLILS